MPAAACHCPASQQVATLQERQGRLAPWRQLHARQQGQALLPVTFHGQTSGAPVLDQGVGLLRIGLQGDAVDGDTVVPENARSTRMRAARMHVLVTPRSDSAGEGCPAAPEAAQAGLGLGVAALVAGETPS